jgi:hypothetical protein
LTICSALPTGVRHMEKARPYVSRDLAVIM